MLILKSKQQKDLENAAEKQRLKQLCKDFQNMIRTEEGARFFVFMMEVYNSVDVDSFIDHVSCVMLENNVIDSPDV